MSGGDGLCCHAPLDSSSKLLSGAFQAELWRIIACELMRHSWSCGAGIRDGTGDTCPVGEV